VSWGCYFTAAALPRTGAAGSNPPVLATALLYVGALAPAFIALSLTAMSGVPGGMTRLLGGVYQGAVPALWYAFAIAYFPAIKFAAAFVHRAALGVWPPFGDAPWYIFAAAVAVSTPVQAGEEIGWRAYALPRLTARFGLARAGLLLGAESTLACVVHNSTRPASSTTHVVVWRRRRIHA
jgi:membrane protease YdiL (CAAX protease family)